MLRFMGSQRVGHQARQRQGPSASQGTLTPEPQAHRRPPLRPLLSPAGSWPPPPAPPPPVPHPPLKTPLQARHSALRLSSIGSTHSSKRGPADPRLPLPGELLEGLEGEAGSRTSCVLRAAERTAGGPAGTAGPSMPQQRPQQTFSGGLHQTGGGRSEMYTHPGHSRALNWTVTGLDDGAGPARQSWGGRLFYRQSQARLWDAAGGHTLRCRGAGGRALGAQTRPAGPLPGSGAGARWPQCVTLGSASSAMRPSSAQTSHPPWWAGTPSPIRRDPQALAHWGSPQCPGCTCVYGRRLCLRPWAVEGDVFTSVQSQSCPTRCDPVDYSMPGLSVHQQFLEFTQTNVH